MKMPSTIISGRMLIEDSVHAPFSFHVGHREDDHAITSPDLKPSYPHDLLLADAARVFYGVHAIRLWVVDSHR